MRLVEDGAVSALCEDANGRRSRVNLLLVGDQPAGTWVLVHIDSAVRVLDPAEAGLISDALSGLAAALDGRPTEALAGYRDALRRWRDLGLPWDEALAGIDMALLLDPTDPDVAAAVASSRAILERLGARPFLERLDRAQQPGGRPVARRLPATEATPSA